MRSVHVIGSASMGGAERFFLRLTAALARRGHETIAVTRPHSQLNARLDPAVRSEHVAMRGNWDLLSRVSMRRLVDRYAPTVVQSYMSRATRMTRLYRRDVLHVARLGGYYKADIYRHADTLVGNTRGICDYLLAQGLPAEQVCHIGNFVEPAPPREAQAGAGLRDELDVPGDAWLLLAMGRLHRNKAFDVLLDALALLGSSILGRPLFLVLLGEGPERRALERQIERNGLAAQVRMPGWRDDTQRYFAAADLFVCPSRHEPLGNVILEAWSAGVAVIAARAAGPVELITDGEDGVLVPIDDAGSLAGAIAGVLGDEKRRAALAQARASVVDCQHSEQAVVDAYLALYARLRGNR